MEWVLDSQPGGYWAMLGGLGLAAASNYKHLPRRGEGLAETATDQTHEVAETSSASNQPAQKIDIPEIDIPERDSSVIESATEKKIDRSEDSISFRVRLPWR